MGEIRRSFSKLKSSMQENEFKSFCKKIAEQYVNSNEEYSRSYFTREYEISESCFYKVLDFAVVYNLIDEETVDKMEIKKYTNQKRKNIEAGMTTLRKISILKHKRYEYILSTYSMNEIEDIALQFIYGKLSKKEYATQKQMPIALLDMLLYKAVTDCIITDIAVNDLEERSIQNAKDLQKTKKFFLEIRKKRADKLGNL